MIELYHITKQFKLGSSTVTALSDVSLRVPTGKIYGVIGSSGAGKSTLLRCVNLLERPTAGSVVVDGVDLTDLPERNMIHVRRQIGMIFQNFNLLSSRTVTGNVSLPLELGNLSRSAIMQRVEELLELVGLENKANVYPDNLSGGQKQRVAIARALANNPKILLCDEATSALDPATTNSILALLKDINQRLGITILLITHEMDVVKRICDQVAFISDGMIIEQAPVSKIFSNPKTALAQGFVRSTLCLDIPQEYQQRIYIENIPGRIPILQLEFTEQSADIPMLSEIARRFNVNNNIISARMDYAGGIKFGILLTEMDGAEDDVASAITYLQQHQVNVKVLGYV
ncbi:MAG: D-methionine ABC transporter, ATP-binding protein [Candidatus Liberibacter ctenarytainae]|uniref:Cell division ATP-binding protein FtsE n=1 Tax=Candidatus Liberibacter ctenarytainae TaxID=2020335 RepID=A0A937AE52_9HYPH|nr:D-methionine ABC transporter, ATP-binding protein [Candidatus Liberibacter ctenarytainae]